MVAIVSGNTIFMRLQTAAFDLKTSASLKKHLEHKGSHRWLREMEESSALLSAVLHVIHPELYASGRAAMEALRAQDEFHEVMEMWSSVFSGVQAISNRECPWHRDNKSQSEWYDLLTTVGPYNMAICDIPGVGMQFEYLSGTVIGLGGRILRHGVSAADGERICLAYYMREAVLRRLGQSDVSWSRLHKVASVCK